MLGLPEGQRNGFFQKGWPRPNIPADSNQVLI
jgi:hypothetical protein